MKRPLPVVLVSAFILASVAWVWLSGVARTRDPYVDCSCASRLKRLWIAVDMWRDDHGGAYPSNWHAIGSYIGSNSNLLVCPNGRSLPGAMLTADEWSDYHLAPQPRSHLGSRAVAAYCNPANHDGSGANVVFLDGRVEWCELEEYGNLLQMQREGPPKAKRTGGSDSQSPEPSF